MIRKLRKRFIRIAMLSVTAVLLLLCVIFNTVNFLSVDSNLTQMLETIAKNRGTLPQTPPDDKKQPQAPSGRHFTPETPFSTRFFVLRYTKDGELQTADLEHIAAVKEEDTENFLSVALSHGDGFGYTDGYKYYVVSTGKETRMAIFLDAYRDLHAALVTALLSFGTMFVCIAVVYVLVVLFSGKAITPVVRSYERQKQFITDAGHELKTPITVIATSLKVLEMEVGKQKWIDKAEAQTERLRELVNSLVTLSRMDEETSPLHPAPFPVSDSITETAESFRSFAEAEGHPLELSIAPGITYCGDEYAIRQLTSILLDNAVKYATPGTPIRFTMEKAKKGIVIRTENRCAGLTAADTEKLFDRFYRADRARAADGSFGIGLSIARSIAEGHHGTAKATLDVAEETIRFTIHLK